MLYCNYTIFTGKVKEKKIQIAVSVSKNILCAYVSLDYILYLWHTAPVIGSTQLQNTVAFVKIA